MLVLLGAGLAALSVWIWPARRDPLDRLLRARRSSLGDVVDHLTDGTPPARTPVESRWVGPAGWASAAGRRDNSGKVDATRDGAQRVGAAAGTGGAVARTNDPVYATRARGAYGGSAWVHGVPGGGPWGGGSEWATNSSGGAGTSDIYGDAAWTSSAPGGALGAGRVRSGRGWAGGADHGAETVAAAAQLRVGILIAGPTAVLAYLIVGGLPGVIAAATAAVAVVTLIRRREPPASRRRRERMIADLPFAADLMVACLRAGQPLTAAAETAATAVGGPLGARLSWVSAQTRLGADPSTAWSALAEDRPLASLARTMSRAVDSGAPVADVLTRLADDARHATRSASSAAARKVGVQAVAPLGLCFLPAFVFLGIIPVVAGLATQVLTP
ncbi:type II secretion system F family protein [Acrocarpospora phusangensis]|uniref:type II secretion system F family protein n=1 Tax=Acrocarpospora phusangensis TaxID=1070424 RepID=UPI0019521F40|nr:type II secretion system F family protein [Acrocarpospora phusangensis]